MEHQHNQYTRLPPSADDSTIQRNGQPARASGSVGFPLARKPRAPVIVAILWGGTQRDRPMTLGHAPDW